MSEMSFTLTKLNSSQSYHFNFSSYTERNETRALLLSFDKLNLDPNNAFFITPSNSTASIMVFIVTESITAQVAAAAVGTTSQVITISAGATAFIMYLQANGRKSQLMRILQIMA